MRFLTEVSQKQMEQAKALSETLARSSKNAWQPVGETITSASKTQDA